MLPGFHVTFLGFAIPQLFPSPGVNCPFHFRHPLEGNPKSHAVYWRLYPVFLVSHIPDRAGGNGTLCRGTCLAGIESLVSHSRMAAEPAHISRKDHVFNQHAGAGI